MSTLDVHTIASSSDEVDQFKSVASLHALSHEHLLHIAFESSQEQENEDGGDKNKKQIRKKKKKSVTEITGGLNRRPGYAETLGQEVRAKRAIFDAKDITVDLSFTIAVVGSE